MLQLQGSPNSKLDTVAEEWIRKPRAGVLLVVDTNNAFTGASLTVVADGDRYVSILARCDAVVPLKLRVKMPHIFVPAMEGNLANRK